MRKQIRPLYVFVCIIAFAFALGLSMAEEAMAGPTDCCSVTPPGCIESHGVSVKFGGTWHCLCSWPENPDECYMFCGECA